MAVQDILAGVVGGVGGAVEGYAWLDEIKRRQEAEQARAQEAATRQQMEARRLQIAEDAAQRAERAGVRGEASEALGAFGPGQAVPPEVAEQARGVGLGYRLEDVRRMPEQLSPMGGLPVPAPLDPTRELLGETTETQHRGTWEQLQASAKRRQEQEQQQQVEDYIAAQPEHLQPALRSKLLLGTMVQPEAFVSPEDRQRQAIEAEQRKADLEVKTHGRKKAIDERYRQPTTTTPSPGGGTGEEIGGEGAPMSPADAALVGAIERNPQIWSQIIPTARTKLAAPLDARGFDFGRANKMTPSLMGAVAGAEGSLELLRAMEPNLTQREGVGGKAAGAVQYVSGLLGEDEIAASYDAVGKSLVVQLARRSGDVGNLNEQEQKRAAAMVPQVTDPSNVRRAKYAMIDALITLSKEQAGMSERNEFLTKLGAVENLATGARGGGGRALASPTTTPSTPTTGARDPLGIR